MARQRPGQTVIDSSLIMQTHPDPCRCFVFSFPELDTLVELESTPVVVVRVSRDTLSAERKASFVRELVAEGFIGEEYLWPSLGSGVRWIIDPSRFMPGEACVVQTRHFVVRLLMLAALLWAALMGGVVLGVLR